MNYQENIILENDRVRLEALNENHYESLLPIALQYPNLLQYSPSPFGDADSLAENIHKSMEARDLEGRYPFVIFDKQKNIFVGSTSYGNISMYDRRLEIGWTWISKDSQGTGLNSNCKYLLLQYAFEALTMERVELKTDSRNAQSRRAIEKLGAIYEGEFRSHTLLLDGHRRNTVYYSILKDEWPAIKSTLFESFKKVY